MSSSGRTRHIKLELPAERDMMMTVRLATSGAIALMPVTLQTMDEIKHAVEEACLCLIANRGDGARLHIDFEIGGGRTLINMTAEGNVSPEKMSDDETELAICVIKALWNDSTVRVTEGTIDSIALTVRGGAD